jgi:hypothetical protein
MQPESAMAVDVHVVLFLTIESSIDSGLLHQPFCQVLAVCLQRRRLLQITKNNNVTSWPIVLCQINGMQNYSSFPDNRW